MQQHLEHLFGGFLDGCHEGLIEIAYTDAQDHKLRHARLFGTDELEEAAEFAFSQNSIPEQNVYVGAALRKPDAAKDKRAGDNDILCLPSFYVDLDENEAASQAKQRYNNCPPTCAVITGRIPHVRVQLWWRQEIPEKDLVKARLQNSVLSVAFHGDSSVVNPSRVMRLAGSIAWPHKLGRVLERTELQLFNDSRPKTYAEGQLARSFPPTQIEKPTKETEAPALNIGSINPLSVEALLHKVRDGQEWHNNLLRLVGHWITRGWSDVEIIAAAESLTLANYRPEQTRREVTQMILGARAKWAIANPVNKVDEFATKPLNPAFIDDLNIALLPKRRWILGRSLLCGHLSLLVAPPGIGKTTLGITQGIAVCIGRNLTGQDVQESGKTWIYNNEDDADELKRRLAAILQHYNIPLSDIRNRLALSSGADRPLLIAKKDRSGNVLRQPDVAACIEFIRLRDIRLFIIDPFIETHEVEENSNEQIKVVAQMFREIARQANCAVLLVHHTAKPPQGSSEGHAGNMNTARGASVLTGAARIVQTVFGMSAKDAQNFGVKEEERYLYIRLDDAKANLSLASPNALWFKRIGVTIANGDEVGVLESVCLTPDSTERTADQEFYRTIIACLLAQIPDETITLNAAAKTLAWGSDQRFHKYRETDSRGYQKATRPLRDAIYNACRANIAIINSEHAQGFSIVPLKQPIELTRFSMAVNPLSQPEFMEDSIV